MPFSESLLQIRQDSRRALAFWPFLLLAAAAFSYLCGMVYLSNEFHVFAWRKLYVCIFLVPVFFLLLLPCCGRFLIPRLSGFTLQRALPLLLFSALCAAFLYQFFPAPLPDLSVSRHLTIAAAGAKNAASTGTVVEIRGARFYNGKAIPLTSFAYKGDWQMVDDSLVSQGLTEAWLEYTGPISGGIAVRFKYSPDAGVVNLVWDGNPVQVDLYARRAAVAETRLDGLGWSGLNASQKTVLVFVYLAYALSLLTLIFFILLLFNSGLVRAYRPLLILAYLLVFGLYLNLKLGYLDFTAERTFRDTDSYLVAAEQPLTSPQFWAGLRPFTLPLFFKVLGISHANLDMRLIFWFQMGLSVLCWSALGLILARGVKQAWLGPLVFGLVLFFDLNLQVGLWDSLVLSESVSISLFALLIAAWLGWFMFPVQSARRPGGWLYLAGMILISVLFTFVRDSNLYSVGLATGVFLLALLLKKIHPALRPGAWVYAGCMLLMALGQSYSLSAGNRWQVFIYDHLALRLLPDAQARDYFAQTGLPVDDHLMSITAMPGYQFHLLLASDPSYEAVRRWVNQSGRKVYFQYLLSRPLASLLEPIQKADQLINGSSLGYINPREDPPSIPEAITRLTGLFYPFSPWLLTLLVLPAIAGAGQYWFKRGSGQAVWLILSALLLSTYPLMFIIWHGEPMEIERHALLLGIQLRLAGWIALPFLLDLGLQNRQVRAGLGLAESAAR